MQISFRHHKHDGEEYPRHGVVEVALNRPYEGMVTVRPLRGCAPEAWLLPRLLEAAGVASVRFEGGAYTVSVPPEWRYGTHESRLLGVTQRKGSTGAYWAHIWALDKYRTQHHAVAGFHASMRGRINENVWGYPDILLAILSRTGMEMPDPDKDTCTIRILRDPDWFPAPPQEGAFTFPVQGGFEYPAPPAVPEMSEVHS